MTNKNNITITAPSPEFIDKWSSTSALLDDPTAMITAVWEAGAQSQHPKGTAALVGNFASSNAALMRKIERVRKVLRNTINKSWVATPVDFTWTNGNEGFIIGGIQRNNGTAYSQRWGDITTDIAEGKTEFATTDVIVLRGAGYYNSGLSVRFSPAWFSMSDGELAKMVRKQVKDAAKAKEQENRAQLAKQKASLEKQLADVLARIESQS